MKRFPENFQTQSCSFAFVLVFYRIMQIVRGGKLSRLHALLVIRGKTFAVA